jgi:hypothetical protein
LAIHHHKPLVLVALTHRAWKLCASSGAARAKVAADKNHVRDGSFSSESSSAPIHHHDKDAPPSVLCEYCGEAVVVGRPLSLHVMNDLFARLDAFKLVPCRDRELERKGWDDTFAVVSAAVQKDLSYYAEHSKLARLAESWEAAGYPESLLMSSRKEVRAWKVWLEKAHRARIEPAPTPLQTIFLQRSAERVRAFRRRGYLSRWLRSSTQPAGSIHERLENAVDPLTPSTPPEPRSI